MTETKNMSVSFEFKREPDQNGEFEGYASVFDVVDNGMDVVQKGAFVKSLDKRKPKLLWQHDMTQPIGVFDEVREDDRGLFVKGRISKEVQKGREAMDLMRMGALDSMSIGYRTVEAIKEGDGRVRRLVELDLFEISLVTMPMLDDAKITDVKSIRTIREFEQSLRDVGFSLTEAKAIAADGFSGLSDHRDDVTDEDEVEEDVLAMLNNLMEMINE